MKLNEFNQEAERLNEAYRNYYSKERLKIIWAVVGELPAEYFHRRVGRVLWADHPPKLDWFQSIRNEFERAQNQRPKSDRPHYSDESQINPRSLRSMIDGIFRKKENY